MKRVVAGLIVIAAVAVVVMFAAWGIAIWQPWGHKQEWKNTALLAMFVAVVAGFGAGLLKDFEVKR
jgi:hypothetical protein